MGLAHQGSYGKTPPPRGPDGTVQVRHWRPKGLAIARWHKAHLGSLAGIKGWAGSNNPPTHLCFSLLAHHPIQVTPTRADSLLASGRPLTRNRKESGRGSGSHLTRAFAGSKPLFGRAPYSLYTHCSNAYRPLS